MSDTESLSIADAEALIAAALEGSGCAGPAAASVARALVAAEAEGQVGHGFSRVNDYAAQVRSGKVNPDASVGVTMAHPTLAVIDADHGFAFPALDVAVETICKVADTQGTAAASVIRSHHCGALSVQVDRIARAGFVGLMMANSPPAIAPWGAAKPLYGTNPIGFAVPRPGGDPMVIDLSLSRVARGKVMHAKKTGKTIPEGWALDVDGNPTTDPDAALAGSMVPIGEAKGTALALMVEILSAVFGGSNLSSEASSFFAAEGPPPGVGQFLMALKPPDDAFFARLERLLSLVAGAQGARLPGERRLKAMAAARANGLAVPAAYLDLARDLAGQGR